MPPLAIVVVGAAAPFATTSYAQARLIRQMHASGLLTDERVARAQRRPELAAPRVGATRRADGAGSAARPC